MIEKIGLRRSEILAGIYGYFIAFIISQIGLALVAVELGYAYESYLAMTFEYFVVAFIFWLPFMSFLGGLGGFVGGKLCEWKSRRCSWIGGVLLGTSCSACWIFGQLYN